MHHPPGPTRPAPTGPLLSRRSALGVVGVTALSAAAAACTPAAAPAPVGTAAPTDPAVASGSSAGASAGGGGSTPPARPVGLTQIAFDDPGYDAPFLRVIGATWDHGADIGEAFVTARSIVPGDRDSWIGQWTALGDRISAIGDRCAAAGHRVSAREAYFRAATYYRNAGVLSFAPPMSAAFEKSYQQQRAAFQKGAALGRWKTQVVQIPYEQTTLEGYFITPGGPGPHPVLVLVDGYDGTKEETYFGGGAAALERGYATLLVDGPGQGGALVDQKLYFRPDWEKVVTPQVDWLLERSDVDPKRIAVMGRSWGGYLAPRAATAEHRIAALVADAAQYDPGADGVKLLPEELRAGFATGDEDELNQALRAEMAASPELEFALNRGMLTHGFSTPIDYVRGVQDYTLEGRADRITCPTMVCVAENDFRGSGGKPLFDALTVPKKAYVEFRNAEGAGEHCETGAYSLFYQRVFDWMDTVLGRAG